MQNEVFNDQERINTLLTRTTGSTMPKSLYLTVAERRRIEGKGKALLNDQRSYRTLSPPAGR